VFNKARYTARGLPAEGNRVLAQLSGSIPMVYKKEKYVRNGLGTSGVYRGSGFGWFGWFCVGSDEKGLIFLAKEKLR